MPEQQVQLAEVVRTILGEIVDGAQPDSGWLLNSGDVGLLRSLDRLSAQEASALPESGGASIAAHVDHLRYGLSLLNRTTKGENPFATADWSASWRRVNVSTSEWQELRDGLRDEAKRWQAGFEPLLTAGELALTGTLASVAHLAYHLGAIRQIDRATRGPAESE